LRRYGKVRPQSVAMDEAMHGGGGSGGMFGGYSSDEAEEEEEEEEEEAWHLSDSEVRLGLGFRV